MNHDWPITCPACGTEYDCHLHFGICPTCGTDYIEWHTLSEIY